MEINIFKQTIIDSINKSQLPLEIKSLVLNIILLEIKNALCENENQILTKRLYNLESSNDNDDTKDDCK